MATLICCGKNKIAVEQNRMSALWLHSKSRATKLRLKASLHQTLIRAFDLSRFYQR